MIVFQTFLVLVMVVAAVCAAAFHDLMNAVIACALVSLLVAIYALGYIQQGPVVKYHALYLLLLTVIVMGIVRSM